MGITKTRSLLATEVVKKMLHYVKSDNILNLLNKLPSMNYIGSLNHDFEDGQFIL